MSASAQTVSNAAIAREARNPAQGTVDIMQREQKRGGGWNQETLSSEQDPPLAGSAMLTAETAYEKARIEGTRATGSIREDCGISIADAQTGVVEASHPQ